MDFALIRFARGIYPRTVACDYLSVHRHQQNGIDAGIYSTVHSISKAATAKKDHHWLTPVLPRIPRSPTPGVVSWPRCSSKANILRSAVLDAVNAGSYVLHEWWTNGTWTTSPSTKRTFVPTDRPTQEKRSKLVKEQQHGGSLKIRFEIQSGEISSGKRNHALNSQEFV